MHNKFAKVITKVNFLCCLKIVKKFLGYLSPKGEKTLLFDGIMKGE